MAEVDETQRPWSFATNRRSFLRAGVAGGAGLAAAALIGCGSDDDDDEGAQPTAGAGTQSPGATGTATQAEPDYVTRAREEGSPYPYNYEEPDKTPKAGGTVHLAVAWDVSIWDTNKSAGAATVSIANFVANRLVGMVTGPKMSKYEIELQPELAKSWETSPDGLTYTFHLAENAKFHNVPPLNGRAFVAKDVVEHYQRASQEGINRSFFDLLDSVTAPDAKTVIIKLKAPDADFLVPLANKALPIFPTELYDQKLIDTTPIGTGPFIYDTAQAGQFIRGRQNPDYFEGKPLLDGFEYRILPDVAARLAAYRAGQVEFANLTATKPEREALLKTDPDTQVIADPITSGGYNGMLALNPNTKFKDERIRQAMMLSMDRDNMVELLAFGEGAILPGFSWPHIFDKMPSGADLGPWFKHDVAEGKKLMQAAGVDSLDFELVSASGLVGPASVEPMYAAFANYFREVGVNMTVRTTDTAAFQSQYYGRQWLTTNSDGIQGWATPSAPTANGYFYTNMYSKSPTNYFGVNDPEIDDWSTKQRSELNAATRKELLRKIWDKVTQKAYRIEGVSSFGSNLWQPYLRYWRFNGPYVGIHSFYDWGMGSHKAWLDK